MRLPKSLIQPFQVFTLDFTTLIMNTKKKQELFEILNMLLESL